LWKFSSLSASVALPALLIAQVEIPSDSVAPGISLSTYHTEAPQVVNVLSIDRTVSRAYLEAYRSRGLVRTSVQAGENERDGHHVIAALNADFFSFETGWPVANQVSNGKLVSGAMSKRSHLAVIGVSTPLIEQLSFSGVAIWQGIHLAIDAVNKEKKGGMSVLYSSLWDRSTTPDSCCVRLRMLLAGEWAVSDTMVAVVNTGESNGQPDGTDREEVSLVLEREQFSRGIPQDGDTMRLFLGFDGQTRRFDQVLGGGGRILNDGVIVGDGERSQEGIRAKFFTDRHPRTFVGFSRDTTILYLCVVDGRQASSVGMNFKEMGDFLLKIGAWNGMNLDGGGSTTMVVNHRIVNSPSDSAGERPVANTLQVVTKDMK